MSSLSGSSSTTLPRINTSTTPSTATSPRRPSVASPIKPSVTSPTRRKWSTSVTPQHTAPLNYPPQQPYRAAVSTVSADPLSHPQLFIAGIISSVVLVGTMYSLFADTALDTSIASLLPDRTAYLAKKSNLLNQIFVKKSWGWTTFAFVIHWISSPPSRAGRRGRMVAFLMATFSWIGFTTWFFGPSLNHRLIAYSGGQCALSVPLSSGIVLEAVQDIAQSLGGRKAEKWGDHVLIPVPASFCHTGRRITRKNVPMLFRALESAGMSDFSSIGKKKLGGGMARWHAGFDISGHMFLLTLSSLILARELAPSWRHWGARAIRGTRGARTSAKISSSKHEGELGRGGWVNRLATVFGTALIGLWTFMLGTTAVYFHNPPEKLAGLALGLVTAGVIYLLTPSVNSAVVKIIPSRTLNALASLDETDASDQVLDGLTRVDENAARRGEESAIVDDEPTKDR